MLWGDWNVCAFESPRSSLNKISCTWQFESKLSLRSFAKSLDKRIFSKTYPSFLTLKEGSTSHLGLLPSGKKRETAPPRRSEPLRSKVGGPSKVFAMFCGMGPPGSCGGRSDAASKPSPWLCGMGPPGDSSL